MTRQGEDLSGRDFSDADLSGANFRDVDLSDADLRRANLQGAILADADLRDADLRDADLRGANLADAVLVGAELSGATLAGANLADAAFEERDEEDVGWEGKEETDSSLSSIVGTVVSAAVLTVAFTLLAIGWSQFWIVFVVGFGAVLPVALALAERYESRASDRGSNDESEGEMSALATLRDRYANGEIDEAEFERRVERLLETESVSDARTASRTSGSTDSDRERETEPN